MQAVNIGLSQEQRQGVINLLNQDLADSYLLIIKTKKYHWDVVGPAFRTLHTLWEEHYTALAMNIDAIAERVRALGGYPVGTAKGFLDNASLKEHPGDLPNANEMVQRLTGLMEQHEEMAWMLRSFLEGEGLSPSGQRETTLKTPAAV